MEEKYEFRYPSTSVIIHKSDMYMYVLYSDEIIMDFPRNLKISTMSVQN